MWNPIGDGFFKWRKFEDNGPPVRFTNAQIRRMLKLAGVTKNDILFELGSGFGQNLLIAISEFKAKKCVGFELIHQRYETAVRRISKRGFSKRIILLKRDYQDLFDGKIPEADIEEATVVLHHLSTDSELANDFFNHLKKGCRLVYDYLSLFPEFKPDKVDYPFYVSTFPFRRPVSEADWLRSVLTTSPSRTSKRANELWSELYHDYNVEDLSKRDILDYKRRLKVVLAK